MISLLWCACAFGEMHAIESVLPTFFGIPWHLGGLRYATPFTVAEAQSIPKTMFSVNAAVVHYNKKPDLDLEGAGLLSALKGRLRQPVK